MPDVVVTCPKNLWSEWIAEGDLPGEPPQSSYHFWVRTLPDIQRGERVYIVAHGKLRGYAPLVGVEKVCTLRSDRSCLMREGGAVAVTIPKPIIGVMGVRYRWWEREIEIPFPEWKSP